MCTSIGAHLVANSGDVGLAAALTFRGAQVETLLCDRVLPACMACEVSWWPNHADFADEGPQSNLCKACYGPAASRWQELGLPINRYSDSLTEDDRQKAKILAQSCAVDDIDTYVYESINVGEQARAGAIRFFASRDLPDDPVTEKTRRRFLEAAIITTMVAYRLFRNKKYDVIVAHHGIYVPQGILTEVANMLGIRVVTWNLSYRAPCLVLSHGDTYHRTLPRDDTSLWRDINWTDAVRREIEEYLRGRISGKKDWITYYKHAMVNVADLEKEIGIDLSKPTVSLFTNVIWDAQIFCTDSAFPSMLDWVKSTIDWFANRPDLQLVIRIHPAEKQHQVKPQQTVAAELASAYEMLPANVWVVPAESIVSSYILAESSNAALVFASKMSLELPTMGVPTIVAGDAWVRGKGLTWDAETEASYFEILNRLPLLQRMPDEMVENAKKYAFHFFFRRSIPVNFLQAKPGGWPPFVFKLNDLSLFYPGRHYGMNVICDGILNEKPFVYEAEREIMAEPNEIAQIVN